MDDLRFFARKGPLTLAAIVRETGDSVGEHDSSRLFRGVEPLDHAGAEDISFLDNSKYVEAFQRSRAGACFVRTQFRDRAPRGMIPIVSDNPYLSFALAQRMFYPQSAPRPGVSDDARLHAQARIGKGVRIESFAVVCAGVEIGDRCTIGAGSVLYENVRIGDDCHVGPNATLMCCVIGDRVWIDAGARLGTQGFGLAHSASGIVRIPHVGRVLVGDDVEVGANTTIDRGTIGDTVIEAGVKIDNQVQIAHNVTVGRHAILAGQTGLAGSAVIGERAMLGGRSSVANHVRVGRGARMAGTSSAASDLAEGKTYLGTPAIPIRDFWRLRIMLLRWLRQEKSHE